MDRDEIVAALFWHVELWPERPLIEWADDVVAPIPYHVVCQSCRMCLVDWPLSECEQPSRHSKTLPPHP